MGDFVGLQKVREDKKLDAGLFVVAVKRLVTAFLWLVFCRLILESGNPDREQRYCEMDDTNELA